MVVTVVVSVEIKVMVVVVEAKVVEDGMKMLVVMMGVMLMVIVMKSKTDQTKAGQRRRSSCQICGSKGR